MFRLGRILVVVFSVAFILAGTVSYADFLNVEVTPPKDTHGEDINKDEVTNFWELTFSSDDETDYAPITEVESTSTGLSYSPDEAPTPGYYMFSTVFYLNPLSALTDEFVNVCFRFMFDANAEIDTIKVNGESVGKPGKLEDPDLNEGNDLYVMDFTLSAAEVGNKHDLSFVLYFPESPVSKSVDFGFKFNNSSVTKGAVITTTPEPATLLVFALASSAAAIPAVRRFRKK